MTHPRPSRFRLSARVVAAVAVIAVLLLAVTIAGGELTSAVSSAIRDAAFGARGRESRLMVTGLAATFTFLTVLLPLPAEAAAILNGILFPAPFAVGLTWVMSMLGAGASYEIGRSFGRRPAVRLFGERRVARIERVAERAGWPMLLGLRLSPVMAFTALNWVSGILALSRSIFYWTTAVGLLPGTIVFAVAPGLLTERSSGGLLLVVGLAIAIGLVAMSVIRVRGADSEPTAESGEGRG